MKLIWEEDRGLKIIHRCKEASPRYMGPYKFVVASKDGEYFLFLFEGWAHAEAARALEREEGCQFVGAGEWMWKGGSNFFVEFGSDTCSQQFGFEAPGDKKMASGIIGQIKETLKDSFAITHAILVIEDDYEEQRRYKRAFGIGVELVAAHTLAEAKKWFTRCRSRDRSSFDAMIVDGEIDGTGTEAVERTCALVREFRQAGFAGTMIAASNSQRNSDMLTAAGCNIDGCGKDRTPRRLLDALGIEPVLEEAE